MALKTRLAKLEKAERERLGAEVRAAEETIKELVRRVFTEAQLEILDWVCLSGDTEGRDLSWEARQELYARRRQQASLEQLHWGLEAHQWLIKQLQAKGAKNEPT